MYESTTVASVTCNEELALFRRLMDESHDMVFILRIEDGYIEYVNKTAERTLGFTFEEMRQLGIEGFRRPLKENELFLSHLQELKQKGKMTDYAVLIRKDGSEFPIEANVSAIHHGGIDYNVAIVRDITERAVYEEHLKAVNEKLVSTVQEKTHELEKQIARLGSYKSAMDANSIVSISDLKGRIVYANEKFIKVSGYGHDELIGQPHSIVRHPDTPKSFFKELWKTIQAKQIWTGVMKNRKKNGETYIVDIAILPILDEKGEISEYLAVRHEITELVEKKEALQRMVYEDDLTGFWSREKMLRDIEEMHSPVLCYIDIDNFNNINDFYGLEYADRLLKEFSHRLCEGIGCDVRYYRLHGDQFAIIQDIRCCSLKNAITALSGPLSGVSASSVFQSTTNPLADRVKNFLEAFNRQSFVFEGKELTLRITASFSAERKEKLVSSCDLAKRHAKRFQKALVVYSPGMGLEDEIRKNMSCAVMLQHALEQDRVQVYCQPIADAISLGIEKYECLVRIIHDNGTVLTPFQFLEVAKQSKQYAELSKMVIIKAFERIEAHPDKTFSINLTIEDILNEEITTLIDEKLSSKLSRMPVIFELVESEGIENYDQVAHFIHSIKSHGALLAIDDFGTGYSNFEYLLKLDADIIKIDGSLIRNIAIDANIEEIIRLIVAFARKQRMQTVAEFVSSEEILEKVREIGIDFVQGYHIGKPEPMNDGRD